MSLTAQQEDRAAGVLVGQAVGDALGVPYEFATPPTGEPRMLGGGLGDYAPGEWSDDTQMAVCIAQSSAWGLDLTSAKALDDISSRFETWYAGRPADIGNQTRTVLAKAARLKGTPSERLLQASRGLAATSSRTAGNGALMRTSVVGLTRLGDREATAAAARAVAELTHADPLALDSCVLWAEAVRIAVFEARFDLASGLDLIPSERRSRWTTWVAEATGSKPATFSPNGFTVTALQCAWAAITSTNDGSGGPEHLQRALTAAVQAGNDTDTVAAIAGGLLGARYGVSGLPARWRRRVHGWPGLRAPELIALALTTARGEVGDDRWPALPHMSYAGATGAQAELGVPHPHDDGVLLGTWRDFRRVDELHVDAVVSLCRIGHRDHAPGGIAPEDHITVWLLDSENPQDNPHLDFVLLDTAQVIAELRREGKRVLVHCVAAQARTPAVAIRYSALLSKPRSEAAALIAAALTPTRGTGWLWTTALGSLG